MIYVLPTWRAPSIKRIFCEPDFRCSSIKDSIFCKAYHCLQSTFQTHYIVSSATFQYTIWNVFRTFQIFIYNNPSLATISSGCNGFQLHPLLFAVILLFSQKCDILYLSAKQFHDRWESHRLRNRISSVDRVPSCDTLVALLLLCWKNICKSWWFYQGTNIPVMSLRK